MMRRPALWVATVVIVVVSLVGVGLAIRAIRSDDGTTGGGGSTPRITDGVGRAPFDPVPRVDLFDVVDDDPAFEPRSIVADGAGRLWFVRETITSGPTELTRGSTSLVRVDVGGTTTEVPIAGESLTNFTRVPQLLKGPDGALWFVLSTYDQTTSRTATAIGTVTAAGVVRRYSQGLEGWLPARVEAGRDGALWFYERQSDPADQPRPRTGRARMAVDGTVTQLASVDRSYVNELYRFPGPATNLDVNDLQWPFADHSVFLNNNDPSVINDAEAGGGANWQLLGSGPGTEGYERPFVRHIAADATRTDYHFDEYERLHGGTGYPLGSQGFAVAPDGSLWLALDADLGSELGSDATIGRLTPDGLFSEITVTRGISRLAIAADGNVWFTSKPPRERGSVVASVGRIVVAPPAAGGTPAPTIPPDANGCIPRAVQGTVPASWPGSLAVLGGPVCPTPPR